MADSPLLDIASLEETVVPTPAVFNASISATVDDTVRAPHDPAVASKLPIANVCGRLHHARGARSAGNTCNTGVAYKSPPNVKKRENTCRAVPPESA